MTDDQPTVYEQMDLKDQKHRHDMERERQKTKQLRAQQRGTIAGWTAAALVLIAGIAGGTYLLAQPPGPDTEAQRESACVANGGGWVPEDLLVNGAAGLCVYPGTRAGDAP